MRISEFLRASCVGALLFSPAMADDLDKVHEEALRVLHENLGQGNQDLPAVAAVPNTAIVHAPALSADPEMARIRAERDARIKLEATQRLAERERLLAERRQQFDQWLRDRESMREQQGRSELGHAQTGSQFQFRSGTDQMHELALAELHKTEAQSVSTPVTTPVQVASATVAVPPATTAPAPTPAPASTMTLAQADADQIHTQALEALHQQTQSPAPKAAAAAAPTNSSGPQPSPDLQRRLKQMQLELDQEQAQKDAARAKGAKPQPMPATTPASTPASNSSGISDAYIKDLEQRAAQQPQQPAAPAVGISSGGGSTINGGAPGLDPSTREILRRQDEEIARQMRAGGARPVAPATQSGAPLIQQGLSPEQEAQARAVLQQQLNSTATAATPTPAPVPNNNPSRPAAPATAATTHRVENDNSNVQYSKELEERARQTLTERAQGPAAPTAAPAGNNPPGNVVIVPSAPPQAAPTAAAQPVAPTAPAAPNTAPVAPSAAPGADASADVHTRAIDMLNQIQAGTAPKTKQQRIKELTDLYRADKMSPAEYHQKRAQILAEPQ